MARFLVSLNYKDKDYAVTGTASDKQNAIAFYNDDCINVAVKATGNDELDVRRNIDINSFTAIEI